MNRLATQRVINGLNLAMESGVERSQRLASQHFRTFRAVNGNQALNVPTV